MMSLRFKLLAVGLAAGVTALGFTAVSVSTVAAAAPTWTTTFRDDFSGSGLPNSTNWQLTLGTSYPGGPANFGTGEIETLTNNPANVNVRNGHLVITPQRDAAGAWTSARVESDRANFKPPARRRHARRKPCADAECHRRAGDGLLAGVLDARQPVPRGPVVVAGRR